MKKSFLYGLLVSALLSSCMKHENLYNGEDDSDKKKKEEYDKNFPVKDIDPNQDWNMAEQMVINVTVNYGGNGEYTIKIYSDNPRDPEVQAYLLGKYTVKDGSTNALAVDAVSGSESVYVCCVDAANGSVMKKGEVENGKVNVGFGVAVKNRAVAGRADGGWREFPVGPIADLVHPETGAFREGQQPQGKGILTSYEFISTGSFTVCPVYGKTDGGDEIGYYYYDPRSDQGINKKTMNSLIANLQIGIILQYQEEIKGQKGWYDWFFDPRISGGGYDEMLQNLKSQGNMIKSKAYEINVPVGNRVGFYVKVGRSTYYSNKILNKGNTIHSAVIYKEGTSSPQYIGLEDNPNVSGRDCNDIVFYIPDAGAGNVTPPDVVDPDNPDTPIGKPDTPATWIIACEDLGSVGDYDFNDIVFGVSHVQNTTEATITPYAAGGTLAANIYWNGEDLGEIHDLLGSTSTTTMINTNSKGKPGKSIKVTVDGNFSMSSNMGGFGLKIGEAAVKILPPNEGKAPQMICVPGGWAWPTERTNITEAYSGFGEWGANYNKTEWWTNSKSGTVVQ